MMRLSLDVGECAGFPLFIRFSRFRLDGQRVFVGTYVTDEEEDYFQWITDALKWKGILTAQV